jgi:TrmH family RNA methyltransferase
MAGRTRAISSIKHPDVAAARRDLRGGAGRAPRCFVADGARLAAQALEAGAPVEALFLLDPPGEAEAALIERARAAGVRCLTASRGVFFRLLGLGYETSARVLAVVRRRLADDAPRPAGDDYCLLLGEAVQDPRNVGVLVRTADAFGLSAAAFTADSADVFSRAAVRSSTGSIFRVAPVLAADAASFASRLKERSVRVIGTSAASGMPCGRADLTGACAVAFGNETRGLSPALRAACDEVVTIPMRGGAHSLNVTVAAGIVLYERARQMRAKREHH